MKSKDKTLKINIVKSKGLKARDNKEQLLEEYFNFLSLIFPHKQELTKVKVFKTSFSL